MPNRGDNNRRPREQNQRASKKLSRGSTAYENELRHMRRLLARVEPQNGETVESDRLNFKRDIEPIISSFRTFETGQLRGVNMRVPGHDHTPILEAFQRAAEHAFNHVDGKLDRHNSQIASRERREDITRDDRHHYNRMFERLQQLRHLQRLMIEADAPEDTVQSFAARIAGREQQFEQRERVFSRRDVDDIQDKRHAYKAQPHRRGGGMSQLEMSRRQAELSRR